MKVRSHYFITQRTLGSLLALLKYLCLITKAPIILCSRNMTLSYRMDQRCCVLEFHNVILIPRRSQNVCRQMFVTAASQPDQPKYLGYVFVELYRQFHIHCGYFICLKNDYNLFHVNYDTFCG
jgi:hypothetical protein